MNIPQTRRAAAAALLAAGGLFLVAAPAQATCMVDDKGKQVCGINQSGPTSGPGSYTGNNGVNNGTPGAPGPDGQPMTAAVPPVVGSGTGPAPANPPVNPSGPANFVAPPPVTVPQANQDGTAGKSPYEYNPAAPANGSGTPAGAPDPAAAVANPVTSAAAADEAASAAASAAAAAAASASPTPSVTATMTERPARPTRTATASAPTAAPVATDRTSATGTFNPVPLIAGIGAVLVAAGLVWFIPGARAAVTSVFTRKGGH